MKKNHLKCEGMVDISAKDVTKRTASARARLVMGPKAFSALIKKGSPKGDVFETAKVAGIMAAKNTPALIPLCHPLALSKVNIVCALDKRTNSVEITSEVVSLGQTGVEMEALVSVSVAALTVYDMMKWADKGMSVKDITLLHKSGGKSGDYCIVT